MAGDEGFLTLTVRMRVRPEPRVVGLMKRYRDALNYSIRWVIQHSAKVGRRYRTSSLSAIHKNLYQALKDNFNPLSRKPIDCYRIMKCTVCGSEGDRDVIALLNIEKRALSQMWGTLTSLNAPQMKDVSPNRCGKTMNPLKETLPFRARRRSAHETDIVSIL